jgi:hypothetical protein
MRACIRYSLRAALALLATVGGCGHAAEPLTPEAAIETTRFMVDSTAITTRNPHGAVSFSPDGRWWIARTIRGDVERNGIWMELLVGDARSLTKASHVRSVARLFSTGLGAGGGTAGPNQDGAAEWSPLAWIDANTVAFLWSDERNRRQVMRLDVRSGHLEPLSAHPQGITTFDAARDGTIVFSALAPPAESNVTEMLRSGFAVDADTDAPSLILGQINNGSLIDRLWRTQWFLQRPGQSSIQVRVAGRKYDPNPYERVWVSPKGGWGLIAATAPEVPAEWVAYREPGMRSRIRYAHDDPSAMLGRLVYQFQVIELSSGSTRPLWCAPTNADGVRVAWSPDEIEVAIAPAYLPLAEGMPDAGLDGQAVAVVNRHTGSYELLPTDLPGQSVASLEWKSPSVIEARLRGADDSKTRVFERRESAWREVASKVRGEPELRFELHQAINTPPVLVAVDSRLNRSQVVIDPNPELADRYELGRAEKWEGDMGEGRRWKGVLIYPPSFDSSRQYPLVIQSVYGRLDTSGFSLYGFAEGYGLGPSLIPPYPGRALARHNILVLHMTIEGDDGRGTPTEAPLRMEAFEHAIATVAKTGNVDVDRIGLLGFSRNGYFVEFTIAHAKYPYRAAVAADHFDAGYVAQTLLGYGMGAARVNGGKPFGDDLSKWVQRAPAFNAENIRAPLLQIEQSRGALGVVLRWETFSRLRFLARPVELWVVPNAHYAVHNTQNPEQITAQQHMVIDWFRFWLSSEEDTNPAKQEQYRRWRKLRELDARLPDQCGCEGKESQARAHISVSR